MGHRDRRASWPAWTVCALLAFSGAAGAAETLDWEDLAPPFDDSIDPFVGLNDAQRNALYELVWARESAQIAIEVEDIILPGQEEEVEARRALEATGLDPDEMLARVDAFERELEVLNATLVDDLDGREVRIPGYALPLEFTDTAVTEFLLVPYVGACIHVPPPPPNQIVHVRVDEGFQSEELYTPVWVTGRMSTGSQSVSLYLVDGTSDVSVGYGLRAETIEPYE